MPRGMKGAPGAWRLEPGSDKSGTASRSATSGPGARRQEPGAGAPATLWTPEDRHYIRLCELAVREQERAWEAFRRRHRERFCERCLGTGYIDAQGLYSYETCPDCLAQRLCPRCGRHASAHDWNLRVPLYAHCRGCGWRD